MNLSTIINTAKAINNSDEMNTLKGFMPTRVRINCRLLKDAFIAGALAGTPELIREITWHGNTIQLLRNDIALARMGRFPGAMVSIHQGVYIIHVNTAWDNAPDFIKEAILCHELGHVELNHVTSIQAGLKHNLSRQFGGRFAVERELAADKFACESGHAEGILQYLTDLEEQGVTSSELRERKTAVSIWINN